MSVTLEHPERLGAVDLGTNSVLLTIAESHAGRIHPVVERATVTRLGQDVDRTRQLRPEAIARTLDCLASYRELLDEHGVTRLAAVGTSALRETREGTDFVERASALLGVRLQVISGAREAELSFRGALSGLTPRGRAFVFDIGGGSTELIWGTQPAADEGVDAVPRIERATSLDLGSVRLHERFAPGDPPDPGTLERMRQYVRGELDAYLPDPAAAGDLDAVVGVAGTVTSLAALSLGLDAYDPTRVHGALCPASELASLGARLARMTLAERLRLPGLHAGRADVIVSGAVLCTTLLEWLGATTLVISDRGVRFGLLHELAGHSARAPRVP